MDFLEMMKGVSSLLKEYLSALKNYTGKIVITINCRKGGIGSYEVETKQSFKKNEVK